MPFRAILANLLAAADSVRAVLFLDDAGEALDVLTAETGVDDPRLLGAYLGVRLKRISESLAAAGAGSTRAVHIARHDSHLYVRLLPRGYYLVLVQDRPALAARTRRSIETAALDLERELFGETLDG